MHHQHEHVPCYRWLRSRPNKTLDVEPRLHGVSALKDDEPRGRRSSWVSASASPRRRSGSARAGGASAEQRGIAANATHFENRWAGRAVSLPTSPLAIIALGLALLSAIIQVAYLILRPPLVRVTKLWLLVGLGILPIGAAFAGNVQGFEATKERAFCGSCHLMSFTSKIRTTSASLSLASRHARNAMFGSENCYTAMPTTGCSAPSSRRLAACGTSG